MSQAVPALKRRQVPLELQAQQVGLGHQSVQLISHLLNHDATDDRGGS
ncbi:unnamed protein product [Schistosoma mattheei]|uniref:Uncharacterized protein n=1 Tax=Schistosoma mattheei TaxID=31246 RepID=A0A183PM80_9TREM|nr:unnamed protein product [Schistosoma mattheei]